MHRYLSLRRSCARLGHGLGRVSIDSLWGGGQQDLQVGRKKTPSSFDVSHVARRPPCPCLGPGLYFHPASLTVAFGVCDEIPAAQYHCQSPAPLSTFVFCHHGDAFVVCLTRCHHSPTWTVTDTSFQRHI